MPDVGATGTQDNPVWLDESKITSNSYPFIYASMGVLDDAEPGKNYSVYSISTTFRGLVSTNSNEDLTGGAITAAEIEGMVPFGRTGYISIVDPTGGWMQKLATVGTQSNEKMGMKGPNIRMGFGWRGLSAIDGRTTEFIKWIDGLIIKVEQDITPEGLFTATVRFTEYATNSLGTLRFTTIEDIRNANPKNLFPSVLSNQSQTAKISETTKTSTEGVTPQAVLNYIFQTKESPGGNTMLFNVAQRLAESGIQYQFIDKNMTEIIYQADLPSVNLGDKVEDYINDVISKMKVVKDIKDKDLQKGLIKSYERQNVRVEEYVEKKSYGGREIIVPNKSIVPWCWITRPDEKSDKKMSEIYEDTPKELKPKIGPKLIWKGPYGEINGDSKLLKSWSTDMSSHDYLIHLFSGEIDKIMEQFQKDELSSFTDKVATAAKEERSRAKAGSVVSGEIGWLERIFTNEEKWKRTAQIFEAQDKIKNLDAGNTSSSSLSQIRAVVLANAFKATAQIMGDPSFGTDFQGAMTQMTTDFKAAGILADIFFSREWLMMRTIHKFSEGDYTTEIEMMGFPPPAVKSPEDAQYESSNFIKTQRTLPNIYQDGKDSTEEALKSERAKIDQDQRNMLR